MAKKNSNKGGDVGFIHKPHTLSEFNKLHKELTSRGFVAIDALKPGTVRNISLAMADAANAGAQDMAASMGGGAWSNGPLSRVAWSFDSRSDSIEHPKDKDGNMLGDGYVKWGAGDNIPSVIPPLAMSSPYTAAPLRYIADQTTGLGVRYMYRMPDGNLVEFKYAGELLQQQIDKLEQKENAGGPAGPRLQEALLSAGQEPGANESKALQRAREALKDWERTWYGYDEKDAMGGTEHIPGVKEFLDDNNLDLHFSQCMQDHVMLDIFFPTIGLQRGRRGAWNPKIVQLSMLPAHSTRLGVKNQWGHINTAFYSDSLRRKGAVGVSSTSAETATQSNTFKMYPAAMPEHLLSDLRYIVSSNQKTRIKDRPTWIVCPTFYPSLNKPYYPQPAWWSVFTSKAFDFSATILYDKYKQRENNTTWGRIIYISLDYLEQVFADEGYQGNPDAQRKYIDELDQSIEEFLQHRENTGKTMRQFMWTGPDGKEHKNVEVVDIKETTNDAVKAGKDELELSTSPIFLALQVDPRLVGVPMVSASNGGTALREMALLKQQHLNIHQRLYINLLQTISTFNGWSERGCWVVKLQTLTTLDNSKTGVVETIASEGA